MTTDDGYMRHALALAARGLGTTWPNPSVGCVIVSDDKIVGRGFTQPGGRPHAETEALRTAGQRAVGATAYVSLEPCAHTGQTGPCAQALVKAKIARVVSAIDDPDPRVAGNGHAMMTAAGLIVVTGVCKAEAAALNAGFFKRIRTGKPLVTVKIASSLDGRMALGNGASKWITGEQARAAGHMLRATHDAVLTGIGTVLSDDPALDCRLPGMASRSPVRFVADSDGKLPPSAILLSHPPGGRVFLMTVTAQTGIDGVEVIAVPRAGSGALDVDAMLLAAGARGITRLLVEAGPALTTSFVRMGAADNIIWFRSGKVFGADAKSAVGDLYLSALDSAPNYRRVASTRMGDDVMETYAAQP